MEKVVLGFSGGLDTTYCVKYLTEDKGLEVHSVVVNTGGFTEDELKKIEAHAYALGVKSHTSVDAVKGYYDSIIKYLIFGNVLKNNTYPLSVSAERLSQALHIAAHVKKVGAKLVAHGSTGAGNDQVRFEVSIAALDPDLKVFAPVRDSGMTRDKAIIFAGEKNLPIDVNKKNPYSIDQNVWGRAIETGFLEDIWNEPIEDIYTYTKNPAEKREADEVLITFKKGLPTHIDGQAVSMLQAIEIMNKRAGDQGIGRIDMVEDRLVGIKSREVYEAPGAMALITAHQELENVCLERELSRFKRGVEQRWGELVYDGLWFSPLRKALDVFIEETQKHVSGDIRMRLHAGKAVVTGRKSAESLYRYDLATYDSEDTYDQSWAKGFIEIFGMTAKIAADRDRKSK
jgi:argininosuccinate synthase